MRFAGEAFDSPFENIKGWQELKLPTPGFRVNVRELIPSATPDGLRQTFPEATTDQLNQFIRRYNNPLDVNRVDKFIFNRLVDPKHPFPLT
jgi:hypothetical protein